MSIPAEYFNERPISPILEMGAYEYLWLQSGASFKRIAEQFRAKPRATPTDFVDPEIAEQTARQVLDVIEDAGIRSFGVRVHGAAQYPKKLRDAIDPVELLYFQGAWELSESPKAVAIVGSRKPSEDGLRRAARLAEQLVLSDYTIVSGLAAGIDTAAHEAAIAADGRTIAVLGTPITETYPRQNRALHTKIAAEHLVISQVPILRYERQTWKSNRFFFPERNKTMSALTQATIIIEAGETSGTLVQARAALQQGRKLFILDSCFKNPNITWPAKFAERGAIRVCDFEDIKWGLDAD